MASREGYLVGLDAGGGGGRALVLSLADGRVTTAYRPWRHRAAAGTDGLGFDLDTEALFDALAGACREALEGAGVGAHEVLGISATSMREGMVLVAGDEVLLATPNRDARALVEGMELAEQRGEELYRRSGRWPLPVFPAARLLWLANNDAERLARADTMFSISDWLLWRLSGERVSEPSQACETMLFDVANCTWDEGLIDGFGFARRLFPETKSAGTRIGSLRPDVAAAFGLATGTPVALGGADSQSGLLGCGLIRAGQAAAITGTTSPVQLLSDSPKLDEQRRTWTGNYLIAGLWVIESNAGFAGETLDWFARTLRPRHRDPVGWLLAEASRSRPGAAGLASTLGADVMNAREPRMPLGHLSLSHMTTADDSDRGAHLARAVVEGLAHALRANFEQAVEVAGAMPETLHMAGGLSRSPFWRQLVADVLGRPVEVAATAEASPLGAAIAAAVGAGLFADLETAAAELASPSLVYEPDAAASGLLGAGHESWKRLCAAQRAAGDEATSIMATELFKKTENEEVAGPLARPRILATAPLDADALDRLGRLGTVDYENYRETMKVLSGDSLIERLQGIDVFITEADLVDVAALDRLPGLRVVASCRSDAVNVDVDACSAFGVPVLNAPGRNAHAVADLTVAFALMLLRKLQQAGAFSREPGARAGDMGRMGRAFKTLVGQELGACSVGLVGFGAVGREVARRLKGFGTRVLAHDPYLAQEAAASEDVEALALDELLAVSDIVSLHLPVTGDTRGLIGVHALAAMKEGAFLINTARGALVDEDALLAALESGHLAGAALDVFSVEPPGAGHPLLARDDVLVTPHIGGNTAEVAGHQGRIIADDLERLLTSRTPLNSLNPETAASFDWRAGPVRPDAAKLRELGQRPAPAMTDLQREGRDRAATTTRSRETGGTEVNGQLRQNMQALLEEFTRRIAADKRLAEAASKTEVSMHFELIDLDLDFHFVLHGGAVSSGVGAPEAGADVELAMRAEILDGMFTGAINGMEAASGGELSFTGDVTKAMSLQDLNGDLDRLYRQAREHTGDPGDLALTRETTGDAGPAPASRGGRGEEVIAVVGELYGAGLITATGGNVSARAEAGKNELLITPSAMFKGELSPELLVRIDLEGRPLDRGSRSPSSERLMHTAIYKAKPEAEAVIHCHAPQATILANTELPFLPISTEAAFFGDIPRLPFIMPGTTELADAVAKAIGGGWAVLMKNHGLIVAGRSLRRASDMAEIIERSAEVMLGCWAVGKEPPVLPADVVERLRATGEMIA